MAGDSPGRNRPRLRGVSHVVAFLVSLVTGPLLVSAAARKGAAGHAAAYALATSALFGTSALLHLVTWPRRQYRWMRRLDHAVIFLFISVSYTVVIGLCLSGTLSTVLLVLSWVGAATGTLVKLFWIDAPKWVAASAYVFMGWLALPAFPGLMAELGALAVLMLLAGGLFFTLGAAVYSLRRPNPAPTVFGYHEIFHVLVIAGVVAHHVVIVGYVLPGPSS